MQSKAPVSNTWVLREVYFDEDGEPTMHREPEDSLAQSLEAALAAAKLLTANDEALMRLAIDAITNVLAGGDFDNPYADLKQAAAALKERLK